MASGDPAGSREIPLDTGTMRWAEHLIKRHWTVSCVFDLNLRFLVIVWSLPLSGTDNGCWRGAVSCRCMKRDIVIYGTIHIWESDYVRRQRQSDLKEVVGRIKKSARFELFCQLFSLCPPVEPVGSDIIKTARSWKCNTFRQLKKERNSTVELACSRCSKVGEQKWQEKLTFYAYCS